MASLPNITERREGLQINTRGEYLIMSTECLVLDSIMEKTSLNPSFLPPVKNMDVWLDQCLSVLVLWRCMDFNSRIPEEEPLLQ